MLLCLSYVSYVFIYVVMYFGIYGMSLFIYVGRPFVRSLFLYLSDRDLVISSFVYTGLYLFRTSVNYLVRSIFR